MAEHDTAREREALSQIVSVRLAPSEAEALRELAQGESLSKYIRNLCLAAIGQNGLESGKAPSRAAQVWSAASSGRESWVQVSFSAPSALVHG